LAIPHSAARSGALAEFVFTGFLSMGKSDGKKKQIPLRLSEKLYAELASWAESDFRSINGQIEYLLTECVKKRKGK
jgi:hypothetical protein